MSQKWKRETNAEYPTDKAENRFTTFTSTFRRKRGKRTTLRADHVTALPCVRSGWPRLVKSDFEQWKVSEVKSSHSTSVSVVFRSQGKHHQRKKPVTDLEYYCCTASHNFRCTRGWRISHGTETSHKNERAAGFEEYLWVSSLGVSTGESFW
jgi:hypothetical protein